MVQEQIIQNPEVSFVEVQDLALRWTESDTGKVVHAAEKGTEDRETGVWPR